MSKWGGGDCLWIMPTVHFIGYILQMSRNPFQELFLSVERVLWRAKLSDRLCNIFDTGSIGF